MSGDQNSPWCQATDDALVETLISAMQRATAATLAGARQPEQEIALPAPEMATALLNLLASVLEGAEECQTPSGMRKVSEAAGKKLLVLMRGCRELQRLAGDDAIH